MKYQNIKTQVIIDVDSKISGSNWVEVGKPTKKMPKIKSKKPENTPVNDTEADNVPNNITKDQIMKELDAFGIKYNVNDKKQALYDLMMKGK